MRRLANSRVNLFPVSHCWRILCPSSVHAELRVLNEPVNYGTICVRLMSFRKTQIEQNDNPTIVRYSPIDTTRSFYFILTSNETLTMYAELLKFTLMRNLKNGFGSVTFQLAPCSEGQRTIRCTFGVT
jgi:hypothetical protein